MSIKIYFQPKQSFARTPNQWQTLWGTQLRSGQHYNTSVTSRPQSTRQTTGSQNNEQIGTINNKKILIFNLDHLIKDMFVFSFFLSFFYFCFFGVLFCFFLFSSKDTKNKKNSWLCYANVKANTFMLPAGVDTVPCCQESVLKLPTQQKRKEIKRRSFSLLKKRHSSDWIQTETL